MARPSTTPSAFGTSLRTWRRRRGLSQMHLAYEAGTTPRHVSILETGRSRPGAEMVDRLAEALHVPLRERNELLRAAGLPPAYPEGGLDDAALASVRDVVEQVMRRHHPYPSWCMGRGLRILRSSPVAERLLPGMASMSAVELVEMWFSPGPFREICENWADVARTSLHLLRVENENAPHPDVAAALQRAQDLAHRLPDPSAPPDLPVVCPILRIGEQRIRTVSTVMRFETARAVEAAEMRIELLFPADAAGAAFFEAVAATLPPGDG